MIIKSTIYESGSIDFTDGSVGNNNSNNYIKKDKFKKLPQKQIFIQDINDIFNKKYNKKYNKKWINELCNNDNHGLNVNDYISLVPNLIFLTKSFFETNEPNYIFNLVIDGIQTLIQSYDIKIQMIKQLYLAFEKDINENKMKVIKYTQLQNINIQNSETEQFVVLDILCQKQSDYKGSGYLWWMGRWF